MWNVTRSGAGAAEDHKLNVWGGSVLAVFALIALVISFIRPGPAGFFGPIMWARLFSILILMAGIGVAMGQLHVRNKQDFFGGVALIGFAVIAFLISIDLPGMRGFAFGPGTAPRLFAGVLATLGLIVAITGLFTDGPEGQRFTLRGTLVVGGALAAWFAMVWLFGQFTAHYAQPLATLVLAVVAVGMLAGSLRLGDVIRAQQEAGTWFVFLQPLGFLVFLVAGLAELNRAPFDLPEAESELVAGFNTEYSGFRWSVFFLAEYANLLAWGAIGATLYLGGWSGWGFLPPWAWFLLKMYGFVFFAMWVRWTLPRIRVDHLMQLAWYVLIPLSLVNLGWTGLWVLLRG